MEKLSRRFHFNSIRKLKRQQGAVLVLLAVGMAALLGVAGLALDGGNLFLNKSKLQNAVDAAALSAGVALNASGGNYTKAKKAAKDRFEAIILTPGNEALKTAYDSQEISLTVTTSPKLNPFTGTNADDDWYVRVAASALQLDSIFLRVVGVDTLNVPATAVAGRTPVGVSDPDDGDDTNPVCGVAPMMVCGDPAQPPTDGSNSYWGYTEGQPEILKSTARSNGAIGPGNFQLVRLSDEDGNTMSGGDAVRDAMAGSDGSCLNAVQGDQIPTEPGNTVGPVVHGLNTRFGIYHGNLKGTESEHPSDYIAGDPRGEPFHDLDGDQADQNYWDYKGYYDNEAKTTCLGCYTTGEDYRRIVSIPVGDCSTVTNGQGTVPLLGMGCFFISKAAEQKGNESEVYGQFVTDCPVGVTPPPGAGPQDHPNTDVPDDTSSTKNKAYIIQLYKNPGSKDS